MRDCDVISDVMSKIAKNCQKSSKSWVFAIFVTTVCSFVVVIGMGYI